MGLGKSGNGMGWEKIGKNGTGLGKVKAGLGGMGLDSCTCAAQYSYSKHVEAQFPVRSDALC